MPYLSKNKDLSEADPVLSCLEEPEGERAAVIGNHCGVRLNDYLGANTLEKMLAN
jgi:hypothetical protein